MDYFLRISKYVTPPKQNFDVYTHLLDGNNIKRQFNSLFEDRVDNLNLELLFRGDAYPEVKRNIILPSATWAK